MAKFFTFQRSKIWDGHGHVDFKGEKKVVRAKDEQRARRKLPPNMSRTWVLIDTKEK